jgi:hypothetical protein
LFEKFLTEVQASPLPNSRGSKAFTLLKLLPVGCLLFRSFVAFGPNGSQLSKNSLRRPQTARLTAILYLPLQEMVVFFRASLPWTKDCLTVRVNRLVCETAIFFDGVHLLPRR